MATVTESSPIPTAVTPDISVWTYTVVDIFYTIIALAGIIGNGLVLFVFFKVPQLRVKTNILIRHQTLVDFISSLLLPFAFIPPERNLGELSERRPFIAGFICKIWYSKYLFWACVKISTTNLVFLTMERYFAVLHSGRYRKLATTRNLVLVCVLAWLVGVVIEVYFPIINNIYDDGECTTRDFTPDKRAPIGYISLLTTLIIPLAVMIFVYTSIIRFLRRHESILAVHREPPSVSNNEVSCLTSVAASSATLNGRSETPSMSATTLAVPSHCSMSSHDNIEKTHQQQTKDCRPKSLGASEELSRSGFGKVAKEGLKIQNEPDLSAQQKVQPRAKSTGDVSAETSLTLTAPKSVVTPSDGHANVGRKARKERGTKTSAELARRNILVTMSIVCVTYIVCWTPDILLYWHHNVIILHDWRDAIHRFAILLAFCNVCTNPVIYTLKYRSFQKGLRTVFGRNPRVW